MSGSEPWTSTIGLENGLPEAVEIRDGCRIPARFDAIGREYRRVRETVAISDVSHFGKFQITGSEAMNVLDRVNMIDVTRIPIQKMGVSLMLEPDGHVLADAYVYNRGSDYLLLTEGKEPKAIAERLAAAVSEIGGAEVIDHTRDWALIDLSGPYAWELLKDLVGVRVVGLRYMEAHEDQKINGIPVTVIRAGKTGEFGYFLLVAANQAGALWKTLLEAGKAYKAAACGSEVLDICRLENRFLNPRKEGLEAANPLELNYRVMISREKPEYVGSDALNEALSEGPARRLIGMTFAGSKVPPIGSAVLLGSDRVGTLVNSTFSPGVNQPIGLALIDTAVAFVGLHFSVEEGGEAWDARTVSAPFLMNRSLAIRPNEDSFHGADLDLTGLDD